MKNRHNEIVRIVDQSYSITFNDLKDHFPDISSVTLRRDLETLDHENRIIRVHGGAKSVKFQIGTDGNLTKRESLNHELKQAIAQKAAEQVDPNTSIFIDSGSTCLEACKYFPDIQALVYTSGVNCCVELSKRKNLKLYTLGGYVNKDTLALSGTTCLSSMEYVNFNTVILGALGCTDELHLTTGEEEAAILKRTAIKHAKKVVVLLDSSKFSTTHTFSFAHISEIHTLITDSRISPQMLEKLKESGTEVVVADV